MNEVCVPATQHDPARRSLVAVLSTLAMLSVMVASAASAEAWPVIGQQGLVRLVVVPQDKATDQAAYEAQVLRLCDPERTCFLNFYTNSTGAAAVVPLPDAIANEATATYRRSMKNGVQVLTWSCRLKIRSQQCF
ncbi:MAG TPA: hypothetical protein VI032_13465 [Burkholderiaceae bacterium]